MKANNINLYQFQTEVLEETKQFSKVAYYYDMGLGKTFIGSEKLRLLDADKNLVVCQKSKLKDWFMHFKDNYEDVKVFDLTKKNMIEQMFNCSEQSVGVINYDIIWRRDELQKLKDFTLLLDESSLIQNEKTKRTKAIMKLKYKNLILLSGTPVAGKYEKLYTQVRMLGWNIGIHEFWKRYVTYYNWDSGAGFPIKIVTGYKNIEDLKRNLYLLGCRFMKTFEVYDLPEQRFTNINIPNDTFQRKFDKVRIVEKDGKEYVGDTTLSFLLYSRMLCNNAYKKERFKELLESTEDRLIIFYNFNEELQTIKSVCESLQKPVSIINSEKKDLQAYNNSDNSVTLVQYQAGAMGLNLQRANKLLFYSPTLSADLYMQSLKRIHRIGQNNTCIYYKFICEVEQLIYDRLDKGEDFTNKLFEEIKNDIR